MLIILAYHSVDQVSDYIYSITPAMFRKQLDLLLKNKIKFVGIDDFIDIYKKQSYLTNNYALVTFDDGYRNNFTEAYPILKELKIPAVIFITTNYVGKIINGSQMLSWEEILNMEKGGLFDFGSHTLNHTLLGNLKNKSEVYDELEKSKRVLEEVLKKEIKCVAYPKGEINGSVLKEASKIYNCGFAGEGVIIKNINNILAIPRITISKKVNLFKFKIMLTGMYWSVKKIKQYFI